ncbi:MULTISPECIES: hypothetical protein [unclassified Phenylobacterium]|uniref:hypothetical protein n=1 Tax=unclassified Phenylobacterium TaxID=2640670 RepID=UPI00083A4F21|nr:MULTISPECIES: hypothetical protein [unclassified Phenylobacterium]
MPASRFVPLLALTLVLLGPTPVFAETTADQMLATAQKIRASVEQLKDKLPAEQQAQMLKQADEIEQQVREGAYAGATAPPREPSLSERLMATHGRLEWLSAEAACAGYTLENYSTFRFSSAINERDTHCRNAYGHWATYLRVTRSGEGEEAAEQALFYYDAAARRAVTFYGRK